MRQMKLNWMCGIVALALWAPVAWSQTAGSSTVSTNVPGWVTRPLSLVDALNLVLQQNGTLLKARKDLEANHGIVVQTRAVVLPSVQVTSGFNAVSQNSIDIAALPPPLGSFQLGQDQSWNAQVRVVQSIYEGGRMLSALRTARLTNEQAVLAYRTAVSDTLLAARISYYDVLLARQQIVVNEASVELLTKELEDQQRRFDAGTVPRFNVLRAEVALANARPALIRARNDYRVAKNNLSNILGYNLPREIWDDIPLQLTDRLVAQPYQIDLPSAISQALERRTELAALRKGEQLQEEAVVNARSGYKPSVQVYGGYGDKSSEFSTDLTVERHGWLAGAQLSWNLFDGMATIGRVQTAKALRDKSKTEVDDTSRRIELEVRTAYSSFVQAREVLESQEKVQEEAEEALRLAKARADAGTGTQLDVLDAETSLTQARTTQSEALHGYATARARLERAIGQDLAPATEGRKAE
ncbi:MAG: TolC family protein [Verrucomicrobiota bacterium]